MRAIQSGANSKGIRFAIVQNGDTFGVYKLCENYAAHCKGGLSHTWRYVQKDMTREEAQKLFDRRAGK